MRKGKLIVAFVEGQKQSVCKNSGWHLTMQFNDKSTQWLEFVPVEAGVKGLGKAIKKYKKD